MSLRIKTCIMLFLLSLLILPNPAIANNDFDVVAPSKERLMGSLNPDIGSTGNDIFFTGSPLHGYFGTSVYSESSFNLFSTLNEGTSFDTTVSTSQPSLANYQGIRDNERSGNLGLHQAYNNTNDPLEINYLTEYVDLGSNLRNEENFGPLDELRDIALIANLNHAVKFNATKGVPLVLEIMFESGDWVDISIIQPNNEAATLSNSYLSARKTEQFPFVPLFTGVHILILNPDTSLVLKSLRILDDLVIEDVDDVISEEFKSIDSATKFYRISIPEGFVLEMAFIHFVYDLFTEYGGVSIKFFNMYTNNLFGSTTSDFTAIVMGDILISITGEAPYYDSRDQKYEEHFDTPAGFKTHFTIWWTFYQITQLLMNENFKVMPMEYDTTYNYYLYNTSEPLFLGVNSTSTNWIYFYPLGEMMGTPTMLLNSNNDDLLHDPNDTPQMFNGTYLVRIDRLQELMFTEFKFKDLVTNLDIEMTLSDVMFLRITTVTMLYFELFMLFKGTNNSVLSSFRFDFFNDLMFWQQTSTFSLGDIHGNGTTFIDNKNATVTTGNKYALRNTYIRVSQTGNSYYNTTPAVPILNTTLVPNYVASFNIALQDRVPLLNDDVVGIKHESCSFGEEGYAIDDFNTSKISTQYYCSMELNRGGYRMTMDTFNVSVNSMALLLAMSYYFNGYSALSIGVNGTLTLDFALVALTTIGLYLKFASLNIGATFNIAIEKLTIQVLKPILLGYLLFHQTPLIYQTEFQRFALPTAIVAVAAIVTGVVLFRRYRLAA